MNVQARGIETATTKFAGREHDPRGFTARPGFLNSLANAVLMLRCGVVAILAFAATMAFAMSGCLVLPLGNSGAMDPTAAAQLKASVPLYDAKQLSSIANYIKVGSITASACDNSFLGGPGQEEVVDRLRLQAQKMGANGLSDLSCGHGSTAEFSGCFSSTSCDATALKVFPASDSKPN
jgi:hypothetical protein